MTADRLILLAVGLLLPTLPFCHKGGFAMPLKLEAYVMSSQVDRYFSTPEDRQAVLEKLRTVGIAKMYLESIRSGYRADKEVLLAARDFFGSQGIEISTGITTTPGQGFGVPSSANKQFINYQAQKSLEDLKEIFEFMAAHFDEIMIDDFFLTDDESEESREAKGDRSWSEYRLALMSEVGREWAAAPARRVNPNVRIILKYPQWYDRFHVYGYNVETGPEIFDEVWVGTETRDPETQRFGFVQPTEGYVNFSWLDSVSRGKAGGAWFDPFDCHEDVYLMQAYQSVLAGAKNLTLFNLGEYMEENPVLAKFIARREAVAGLAEIVGDRRNRGILAYKPPNSEPGNDGYLFDFLAVLGIPVSPVGYAPQDTPASVVLTAHSARDPEIASHLERWAKEGCVMVVTPDFLCQVGDRKKAAEMAGFGAGVPTELETFVSESLAMDGEKVQIGRLARFADWPSPSDAEVLATADHEGKEVPLLTRKSFDSGGAVVFLNVFSFRGEDFDPEVEMFLSPLRLAIPDWPAKFADLVRAQIPSPHPFRVEGAPPFGLYCYGEDTLIFANLRPQQKPIRLRTKGSSSPKVTLDPRFPHVAEAKVESGREPGVVRVTLPPWEVVVLKIEGK